mmetsp:Transcript_10637/g.15191  ORF Transcript_10637/g.15191 Transcript_10637/m.15191 type:complete len:131 (+) Transcript_10637:1363-1755(+)
MISGVTPFYEEGMEQLILFEKIVDGKFEFPTEGKVLSATAEDLVLRLLVVDPSQRLGSLARGEKDIYNDPFFADIKFDAIRRRHVRSPWVPTIKDALDTSNFDEYNHLRDKCTLDEPSIPPSDDKLFMSF